MRAQELVRLLPRSFQAQVTRGGEPVGPLGGLLGAMEVMHDPPERVLGAIDVWFDPLVAPDAFVAHLATWVDLQWLLERDPETGLRVELPGGAGRLRHLLLAASSLSAARGTPGALVRFLQLAGVPGAVVEVPGAPFLFVLHLPPSAQAHDPLVRRVVDRMKPAHVRAQITYDAPEAHDGG